MKYLNTYRLFESIDVNVISDCKDILLELNDEGFETSVTETAGSAGKSKKKNGVFSYDGINILIANRKSYEIYDILEVLARLQSYLKSCEFEPRNDLCESFWEKYMGNIDKIHGFDLETLEPTHGEMWLIRLKYVKEK